MAADAGAATFAVAQGVGAFTSFMPKITDVRKASVDDAGFVADLRVAEIGAAVITIGVAVIVTTLTGSQVPVVTAVFISLVIVCLYETVLRRNPERY